MRRNAATGGKCRAEGGASAEQVARKITRMKEASAHCGKLPSNGECADGWSVGSGLYARTRVQCAEAA